MAKKKLPLVISAPHAASIVPPEFRDRIALTDEQLWRFSDPFTDETAEHPRAWSLHTSQVSRGLADLNRRPDPETAFAKKDFRGNKIWKDGSEPDEVECREMLHKFWFSYYDEICKSIKKLVARGHRKILFIDHHNTMFDHAVGDSGEYMPSIVISNFGTRNRGARRKGETVSMPAGAMKVFQRELKKSTGLGVEVNRVFRGGYAIRWVQKNVEKLEERVTFYGVQFEYNLGFIHNPLSGRNDRIAMQILRERVNDAIDGLADYLKL